MRCHKYLFSFSDVHFAFFSFWLSSETMMTYFDPLEWIIKFKFKLELEFPLFRSIRFLSQSLRISAIPIPPHTTKSFFHIFFHVRKKIYLWRRYDRTNGGELVILKQK